MGERPVRDNALIIAPEARDPELALGHRWQGVGSLSDDHPSICNAPICRQIPFRHFGMLTAFVASTAARTPPSSGYFAGVVLRVPPSRTRLAQRAAYCKP